MWEALWRGSDYATIYFSDAKPESLVTSAFISRFCLENIAVVKENLLPRLISSQPNNCAGGLMTEHVAG